RGADASRAMQIKRPQHVADIMTGHSLCFVEIVRPGRNLFVVIPGEGPALPAPLSRGVLDRKKDTDSCPSPPRACECGRKREMRRKIFRREKNGAADGHKTETRPYSRPPGRSNVAGNKSGRG